MRAYRDPTADIAIAHVMRKKKKKHSGVARYHEPKCTGGKTIRINKAEWFYSRFNRAIKEGNMELKVVYMAPEELKPYKNNAKRHPEEQIEQIKESIKEFGFNDPIAIDKNNVVVEGHGRLIAATELGLEKVPVIRLDELTEEQRKAYTLIHNKLTMNSGFDFSMLSMELSDLKDTFDMSNFGFGDFELDNLGEEFEPDPYDKEIEEEYGENGLIAYNVIISCLNDEEQEWLKGLLKEDGKLNRLYDCSKLMERFKE